MGGGVMPLFFIAGSVTPVWITPKVSVPLIKDNLNLGAGALLSRVIGFSGYSFGILSAGGRSVQKRLAVDYGLVFPVGAETGTVIAIPWPGIVVPFGKGRD